ncbi:toll/interleukin-1 receptor domain-containing protein [Clostridium botulinum]|uniref:toll/interleukin-1 receptor domain-containing protein n=1 Tax=Clostridium botulinum TaxID=1491 RepID=UPI001E4FF07C|nr:toll/interleukin-1 receptor domain-containing protein [Clostridium botulinum]MCC5439663.1 toll/interleukin-1 receptor domain-containing protein [Clostridium botulinum]NFR56444.1 TIR domain-containing protein [Clostridium botulinum]
MTKLIDVEIDKENMVSISYSVTRKLEADQVYYFFKDNKVNILRDEFNVEYNESYEGFMGKVADCEYIIMILSQEFFHSRHCMNEAILAINREDYIKRIIPIITMKQDIDSAEERGRLLVFWNDKLSKLESLYKNINNSRNTEQICKDIELYENIINNLDDVLKKLSEIKGYELTGNDLNLEEVCKMVYSYIFGKAPSVQTVRKREELIRYTEYEIFNIKDDILRIYMAEFIEDLKRCSSFEVSVFPEDPPGEKEYHYIRHSIIESTFGPSLYLTMYDINNKEVTLGINDIKAVEFNNSFHGDRFFKYYIRICNRENLRDYEREIRLPKQCQNVGKIQNYLETMELSYRFILKFREKNAYED